MVPHSCLYSNGGGSESAEFAGAIGSNQNELEEAEQMRILILIAVLASAAACASLGDAREARFTPLGASMVSDARLRIVWTSRDAGEELSWRDADLYCRQLSLGASDEEWRLPTSDELGSLFDATREQPCGKTALCLTDPAIDLSTPYQWSATAPRPDRRVYRDLSLGTQLSPLIRPSLTRGTLCVRKEENENRNYKAHFLKMFVYLRTTNPHRRRLSPEPGEFYQLLTYGDNADLENGLAAWGRSYSDDPPSVARRKDMTGNSRGGCSYFRGSPEFRHTARSLASPV